MSRTFLPIMVIAFLAAAPLAGVSAETDGPPVVLRLDGHELLDCDPENLVLDCFKVQEGNPATAFIVGATVRVALTAAGEAPHALAVIDADEKGTQGLPVTMTSGAIATSDQAESGETVYLEFTVPDVLTLYFWCPVGTHEPSGMFFEADVQPAANLTNGTDGTDGNGNEAGEDDSPADDNQTAENGTNETVTNPSEESEVVEEETSNGNMTTESADNTTLLPDEEDAPLHLAGPLAVLGFLGMLAVNRRRLS